MTSKSHITTLLRNLQQDLYDLSARNPLMQVDREKLWILDSGSDIKNAQKIYQKSRFFEKEYGLPTTLLVSHFIRWKHPQQQIFYTSPLICKSVKIAEKKRENISYSISETEETVFINPVLQKAFEEHFQLKFPETAEPFENLVSWLTSEFEKIQVTGSFNTAQSWQIIAQNAVGIFNYKKLLLARDYDTLIKYPGDTLLQLLGEKKQPDINSSFDSYADQFLDPSQKKALQQAASRHTVIQGPPGTGKSETIVALIKTLVLQQKKVLFVSEKRSALEVVFQRLKKEKLDLQTAFFNPDKDEKKQFYAHLKKSWEQAAQLEKRVLPATGKRNTTGLFSYYPEKFLSGDLSGISTQMLLEKLVGQVSADISFEKLIPDYNSWQKHAPFLVSFEEIVQKEMAVTKLSDVSFIQLNATVFQESEPIRKLSKHLDQLENSVQKINALITQYDLDKNRDAFSKLAITASILAMVNKNQLDLLQPEHKHYKTFNTLAKKYQLTKNKLQQAEQVNKNWKRKPSVAEITALTDLLKQRKKSGSILGILKRNSTKSHDYFSGFPADLSTVAKLQLLEEVRTEWHLKGELEAIRIKLKHDLQILNPDTEIDHILQVRTKLGSVSQNQYITLLEHPDSEQLVNDLSSIHTTLNQLSGLISYLFAKAPGKSFTDLQHHLDSLKKERTFLHKLEHELTRFFKLPEAVLQLVRATKNNVRELDLLVIQHQLHQQTRFEPAFKKLDGNELLSDFEEKRTSLKNLAENQVSEIHQRIRKNLHDAEKLAETPASKLKPEAKMLKQQFKEAKRTLVHEFTKKQQHLPVAELMQHHAETVLNLQPVWIMNPMAVSQFLPCTEALFDYVIFDEASQVPLEDAIPAVFRGSNITVVGDSQQMPPGRFFASNPEGKTLLDQAEFTCTQSMLTHHYRSEHPDLIAFSNNHFYDHELVTLPPVSNIRPIELVQVNGVFEDNKNISEAKALAIHYKTLLNQGKTAIGIIAFSKEQQTEIEKQLALLKLPENEFLLVRNLENVQGIEKEIILISVGYGKNKEGIFRKNLGPVNQERGANRLNVLFTRAIQQMIIFTSISGADFGLSDNRGLTILGEFLSFAETSASPDISDQKTSSAEKIIADLLHQHKLETTYYAAGNGIAVSCFVQHATGKILLVDPARHIHTADTLFSLLVALEKRFTKIKLVTLRELVFDQKQVEKEVIHFFKKPN